MTHPTRRILLGTGAVALAAGFGAFGLTGLAQQRTAFAPKALTAADYARAEKMQGAGLAGLVVNNAVRPTWISDTKFSYRNTKVTPGSDAVTNDLILDRCREGDAHGVRADLGRRRLHGTHSGTDERGVEPHSSGRTRRWARRRPGSRRRWRWARRGRSRRAPRSHVSRRQAVGLDPQRQSLRPRHRHGHRAPAHNRRRQRLRLRHRQRRLGQIRSARRCCGRRTRKSSSPFSRISAASVRCTS